MQVPHAVVVRQWLRLTLSQSCLLSIVLPRMEDINSWRLELRAISLYRYVCGHSMWWPQGSQTSYMTAESSEENLCSELM